MKLFVCAAVALCAVLVRGDPDVFGPQDARKVRNPASGPTSYNTIAPQDSETLSKLQNQVAPTVQIPSKAPTTVAKAPEVASPFQTVAPPSIVQPSPYLRQPAQSITPVSAQGQYYLAMVPQPTGNHMLQPATTPLIMQYINPQGQPTGGLQYIQLLRPVVYPYGANQQYQQYQQYQGYLQQSPANLATSPHGHIPSAAYNVSPTPPPTTSTTQPGFVPFQPVAPQYAPVSHPQAPQQQTIYGSGPVGQYSSPVLSYYPHRFLINPSEMNFNTNEYVPSPGDSVYLKGVKSIRA